MVLFCLFSLHATLLVIDLEFIEAPFWIDDIGASSGFADKEPRSSAS